MRLCATGAGRAADSAGDWRWFLCAIVCGMPSCPVPVDVWTDPDPGSSASLLLNSRPFSTSLIMRGSYCARTRPTPGLGMTLSSPGRSLGLAAGGHAPSNHRGGPVHRRRLPSAGDPTTLDAKGSVRPDARFIAGTKGLAAGSTTLVAFIDPGGGGGPPRPR